MPDESLVGYCQLVDKASGPGVESKGPEKDYLLALMNRNPDD